jgi:transcriptional regulator with XRE-family HTH domain
MAAQQLGERLKEIRDLKGLSLAAVAGPAGVSAPYLQKLEQGKVDAPSPHRLYSLAGVLGVSYADLMQLAGYIVPREEDPDPARDRGNLLLQALSSNGELTDEDLASMAEWLAFRRHQQSRRSS